MLLVHMKPMAGGITLLLIAALMLLLVSAGIEDARTRQIANKKNLAIAALAIPYWWTSDLSLWPDVAMQLGVAAAVFGIFIGIFALGQMGGGDVKLIGALALWLPLEPLIWMLMLMALLGGILTAFMLSAHKFMKNNNINLEIPYGIAISTSAIIVISKYNINLL